LISKKFLFVSFCFVVLVVAFGAYGYTLYSQVSSLGSRLEDLQREINLMRRALFTNSSETFNFFWQGPIAEKFNVTTFWMNITFQRTNETTLLITVKINHLRHDNISFDYVGIVFDVNHNGEIDGLDDGWMYMRLKYYMEPYSAKRHAFLDGPYNGSQRFFHSMAECYV